MARGRATSRRGRAALSLLALASLACARPPLALARDADPGPDGVHHARPGEERHRHPVSTRALPFARDIARLGMAPLEPGGRRSVCTATLLEGGRHLLTALHCLVREGEDGASARAVRHRGRYQIVLGYSEREWIADHAGVIEGHDLFAGGAVREWPELDLALIRLDSPPRLGVLRREGEALVFEPAAAGEGGVSFAGRGIALLPARFEPVEPGALARWVAGATAGPADERLRDLYGLGLRSAFAGGALYGYSTDVEIGRRGRVLTAESDCAPRLGLRAASELEEHGSWVDCRAHPGASGAPYLRRARADGRPYLVGVAIESLHEERRVRAVPVWAFREEALAFMADGRDSAGDAH